MSTSSSVLSFPAAAPACPPYVAVLPGRSAWLSVCHLVPAECDHCLEKIAEFLATELRFDLGKALERTTAEYRAELGAEQCSFTRAADLRRMTCRRCMDAMSRRDNTLRLGDGFDAWMEDDGPEHRDVWMGDVELSAADELALGREYESRRKAAEAAAAAKVAELVVRKPEMVQEYFCERADQWLPHRCWHAGCQPEPAEILKFPEPDQKPDRAPDQATPFPPPRGWEMWRHVAACCLLWPAIVGVGGMLFAVVAVAVVLAAVAGEEV